MIPMYRTLRVRAQKRYRNMAFCALSVEAHANTNKRCTSNAHLFSLEPAKLMVVHAFIMHKEAMIILLWVEWRWISGCFGNHAKMHALHIHMLVGPPMHKIDP